MNDAHYVPTTPAAFGPKNLKYISCIISVYVVCLVMVSNEIIIHCFQFTIAKTNHDNASLLLNILVQFIAVLPTINLHNRQIISVRHYKQNWSAAFLFVVEPHHRPPSFH